MAREKRTAVQRTPSELLAQSNGLVVENGDLSKTTTRPQTCAAVAEKAASPKPAEGGVVTLLVCVAGIYASLYVPSWMRRLELTQAA
jgi:hypothetical protein